MEKNNRKSFAFNRYLSALVKFHNDLYFKKIYYYY